VKVNDRVSWIETYKTVGNVIAQRMCWGTVLEVYDHPGERDGHSIKGQYVRVMPVAGGSSVSLLANHITSSLKG
jgi:hypothetical protein